MKKDVAISVVFLFFVGITVLGFGVYSYIDFVNTNENPNIVYGTVTINGQSYSVPFKQTISEDVFFVIYPSVIVGCVLFVMAFTIVFVGYKKKEKSKVRS